MLLATGAAVIAAIALAGAVLLGIYKFFLRTWNFFIESLVLDHRPDPHTQPRFSPAGASRPERYWKRFYSKGFPAMEALLPLLLAFPPHPAPVVPLSDAEYDKQIKEIVHHLSTIPASKLTSGVPGGGDLLDVSAA